MTFAQLIGTPSTGIVGAINLIVVPVIFALAFLVFVWGVAKYFFWNNKDDTSRTKAREFALWGLIGMVVLLSVWGFVNIMLSTLGINPPA